MKKAIFALLFLFSSIVFAEPKKGDKNYFPNCKALNKVYPKGVPKKHPAYRATLDRNKNDWACEPKPK